MLLLTKLNPTYSTVMKRVMMTAARAKTTLTMLRRLSSRNSMTSMMTLVGMTVLAPMRICKREASPIAKWISLKRQGRPGAKHL